ncbi:hypothetical protein AAGR22_06710 [Erwinia sp. HDF1-3R]|uniref:hypothetical protein n=1 Tax=Erwinia sp. HDF1-3R TaxID=3141543 RepID=UPI0031F5AEA8
MSINVQFTASDKKVICGYLSDYQDDLKAYPNQGTVELTDERWLEYYNSAGLALQWMLPKPE